MTVVCGRGVGRGAHRRRLGFLLVLLLGWQLQLSLAQSEASEPGHSSQGISGQPVSSPSLVVTSTVNDDVQPSTSTAPRASSTPSQSTAGSAAEQVARTATDDAPVNGGRSLATVPDATARHLHRLSYYMPSFEKTFHDLEQRVTEIVNHADMPLDGPSGRVHRLRSILRQAKRMLKQEAGLKARGKGKVESYSDTEVAQKFDEQVRRHARIVANLELRLNRLSKAADEVYRQIAGQVNHVASMKAQLLASKGSGPLSSVSAAPSVESSSSSSFFRALVTVLVLVLLAVLSYAFVEHYSEQKVEEHDSERDEILGGASSAAELFDSLQRLEEDDDDEDDVAASPVSRRDGILEDGGAFESGKDVSSGPAAAGKDHVNNADDEEEVEEQEEEENDCA